MVKNTEKSMKSAKSEEIRRNQKNQGVSISRLIIFSLKPEIFKKLFQ
jgi:hypothetical protein